MADSSNILPALLDVSYRLPLSAAQFEALKAIAQHEGKDPGLWLEEQVGQAIAFQVQIGPLLRHFREQA